MTQIWACTIIGLLLLFVVGCGSQAVSDGVPSPAATVTDSVPTVNMALTVSIGSLQRPEAKNSTVQLRGKVGDRVPLLDGTVYELQDSTGKVWVLTKTQPPASGQEIVVKGIVRYKSISLNGKEQGSIYVEAEPN